MKKYIFVLLLLCPLCIWAQSVEWITKPVYDFVRPIQYDLIKIKVNDKVGIISNKGTIIVEPIYDSITDFKDGIALIVDKRCKQLMGAVYGDTQAVIMLDGYEIDSYFPYFSDGLLAVKNVNAKWGFLNISLEECQGYLSCKNESVLPFSEGVTYIKVNSKEHAYFDVNGNPLIGDFGKTVDGYSFTNGEAIVFLNNSSWAWIDMKGNVRRTVKAPKQKSYPTKNGIRTVSHSGNVFEFDAQWCLVRTKIDGKLEEYEHLIETDKYNDVQTGMLSLNDNILYFNEKEIIPKQFDDVIILSGEYVAVANNGKYGILHILPNQNIRADLAAKDIVFYHASQKKVSYDIQIPEHLMNKDVEIQLEDVNRNNIDHDVVRKNNSINVAFDVYPHDSKFNRETSEEYRVIMYSDGIKYFEETFTINKSQKKGFSISCAKNTLSADSLGYATSEIIVRNNTKIKSGTTTVVVSCDGEKETITKKFNAGESINIPIAINAVMSDDFIDKEIGVSIYEDDYPEIHTKEKLTIYRYIPKNNNY